MIASMERREEFVKENLGLVHSCARRFYGKGIEYDDLYSAGCMGLVKAVNAFDENRGVRFSTYAVPVILGEIRRLFRDGGAVKVSRSLKELSLKITREKESFSQANGREPTIAELAKQMELPVEDIVEALGAGTPPISLTAEEDDGGGQLDIPTDPLEEKVIINLSLKESIAELDNRDRNLILLRYFRGKTQMETAEELGMTQVQVSRREKKILLQMRSKLE